MPLVNNPERLAFQAMVTQSISDKVNRSTVHDKNDSGKDETGDKTHNKDS